MPIRKTTAELFAGQRKTTAQLFGEEVEPNKIKGEIPSGDRLLNQLPSYRQLYEKVLSGEQDWDSFIPPDKRAVMQQSFLDYEESGKRLINSAYFADQFGIDIDSAHATHGQLADALLKEKVPTKVFDRIKNRFNNGRISIKRMDLGYDLLTGRGDFEANLKAIEKLQSQLTSDYKKDLRSLGEQMIGATAEQLPNMWQAIKASPWGAVSGGIIGALAAVGAGQLGPQVALPEETVTVPAGAMLGIKIGGGLLAANRIRQLEAGGNFLELLEMKDKNGNKIDPRIAKATAHIVGAINGGIELTEWAILLETFGIGTKVFEEAATKVVSKVFAKGTLKHIALKYSLKYGAALSGEVLQEISQESTNIVLGELAKQINNQTKGTDIKPITADELSARYYEVAAESLKGFALLVAPGTMITGAKEAITRKSVSIKPKGPVAPAVKAEKPPVVPVEPQTAVVQPLTTPKEDMAAQEAVEQTIEEDISEVEFTEQETADLAQLEALLEKEYKPSGRKPAKKIREFLNPKATVEKVITEYNALKAAMKKTATAARRAFTEGKKEGIIKAKQHYTELKLADKQRKELKKRIAKALKQITKPPPKTVDFFYREAIEILQQGIDPKFRTKKTLAMRQRMKEFLEQATPEQKKDFPVKLARILDKKDLRQYTVEELEQLADNIAQLEKLGKTKKKARLAIETTEKEKNVEQMISSAGYAPPAEQAPKGIDYSSEGITKAVKAGYLWTLRIPRILDWLDGRKGTFSGIWHRLFYDQVNRQTDKALVETDSRIAAGTDKMKALGITVDELAEVTDFSELQDGLALTVEQQMGLYAALKNRLATDAVVNGNKINLKAARAVVSNLDKKYKALADWIIEEYNKHYDQLRQAHIEATDEDMGYEEFYSPMVRLEKSEFVTNEEIKDQLLQRHGLKRGYAEKGFTIERKEIAPEHQKPIDIRLVSVWQSQVAKQEHYINFAKLVKDLRRILGDKNIKAAVGKKFGKEGWNLLDKYVSRVANPNIYKGFGGLAGISRIVRGNVAIAYLAYNLLTIAKQVPSLVLYTKDAGVCSMVSSVVEFARNPRQIWDMVRAKDPQVRHAYIERELAELKQAAKGIKDKNVFDKITKIIARLGDKGMVGIKFVDGIVRTIGWNAVYQKNMQLGLGEAESVRLAQNSTLRTQPAASAKDIAQLYATDEFLNWFTMFTNQLNNIWNITTYDTFAYWNNKKYQDAALSLMAVSISGLSVWMLVNKKLPEDEEDLIDAATDQVLNMLPLIGAGAMTGKRGWGTLTPPPIEAARATGAVLSAKDKEKAAIKALEKFLVLTGIPVTAMKRAGRFTETGDPIELIGGGEKKKKISF